MSIETGVYNELSQKIMVPSSELIPELFRMLVDEEDAQVLLALPATAADLAQKFDLKLEEMDAKLADFFVKGLVFKSRRDEGISYRLCRDVMQFHDSTILWPGASRAYHDLWQRYMEEEWPEYTKLVEAFMPRPTTRIIPVDTSLAVKSEVLAYEDVRNLVESATRIAVTRCTCRLIAHKCDRPVEVCLQLDRAADYTLERGTGREVTTDEAMDIVRDCEEAGLVHVTMNRTENMLFICNCCECCCVVMPVMIEHGRKLVDPSRFLAAVDPDACLACGTCEERCFFGAVELLDEGIAAIEAQKCMGCGSCQVTCTGDAITLSEVRERAFIPS